MKFAVDMDRIIYGAEVKASGLNEFEFIRKRKERVKVLKDFRKSQDQKANWRKNRWKLLKGIKAFHKSTEGKKFHRKLGTFLATRTFDGLRYNEVLEFIPITTSLLTHIFLELDYWRGLTEEVDYSLFSEEVLSECLSVLSTIEDFIGGDSYNSVCELKEYGEFFIRLCETNALITSFAKEYGKSEKEVERLWNATKEIVKKQYEIDDSDSKFYSLLVFILKKSLSAKS